MRTVRAKHVTQANFALFGSVVATPSGSPTSQAADYKFWSDLVSYTIDGETEIGICTVYAQPDVEIGGMERHVRTPEILIPIDAPFVLPLLREGEPDAAAEAFRVDLGEAVVINTGVWHGACLPVGKGESSYFVIFRRKTPQEDVQKKSVASFRIVEA
jgi:ureidoglycolate hydrolase